MRLQQTLQEFRNRLNAKRRRQRCKKTSRRLELEQLESRLVPTGTWHALSNLAPSGPGTMILLSNGSAMVQGSFGSTSWYKLTPDSTGSYVNGTWSTLASDNVGPLYYGSAVLSDGRVLVVGGEYNAANGSTVVDANSGEIYDPVANTWTTIANYPETHFGDGMLEVLPNGKVLGGGCCSGNTYIYNPANNTWTFAASSLNGDSNNEEGWVKLAESGTNGFGLGSGNLLSYEIGGFSPQTGQRYDPSSNTWNSADSVPVRLDRGSELGPSVLLPNGQVFWIGATNHTALYTPSNNTWTAGPDTPNDANGNVVGGYDAPAALEPNGKILYAANELTVNSSGQPSSSGPTTIYEYDAASNTTVAVPATNGPDLSGTTFPDRMLVLPSGQVLFSNSGRQLFVYTPDSSPNSAWQPTISNIHGSTSVATLVGTQLNGLSEGASYGDDAQMASNYPIIQLLDSGGTVRYARTSNWSSTGVATGSAPESTLFSMPAGAPNANLMHVIANGISSNGVLFVNGTGGNDTITLDTAVVTFFGITFDYVTVNVDGVSSSWFAPFVSSVFVDTGSGNVSVNVNDTWAGIPTFINSGSGNDTVNIGTGGSVQGIAGNVTIENTGALSTISIDDSAGSTARTTTLQTVTLGNDLDGDSDSAGQITGLAPGVISYEYADASSVNIKTGTGGNTINVLATGTTTNLIGSHGGTTVNVGNAGSVQGIAGTLNIENPPSFNTINVDDSLHNTSVATTVTLSTLGTNPSDSQGSSDPWGQIIGLAPAHINYEYFDTTSLTINGGGGTGLHTWNILATSVTTTISGGSGADTFNVGTGGALSNLNAIQRPLTVNGGLGTNTLNVNDQGTAGDSFTLSSTVLTRVLPSTVSITYGTIKALNLNAGGNDTLTVLSPVPTTTTKFNAGGGNNTLIGANLSNIWNITATNKGTLGKIIFTNVQNLIGGTGLDTFKFSTAGRVSNITGGGAPPGQGDWLDYSSFSSLSPVNVNLLLGTSSNVSGSISGIENVIGGAGADVLTGDNNGNILIEHGGAGTINGGTGRSLFITGTGAVTVNGGSGGDIFIGGQTSYDTTRTGHLDLMYILAEWRNTVDSYATRTDEISDGIIPGHPGVKLFVGAGGTVTLNPSSTFEHLNGFPSSTDLDWFFASAATQHSPLETVGGVTEIVNNAS